MDGVLKSWAVTRGPSLVTGEKRLSVHVEDHPLDYGGFEGVIPPKQYGAGNVIIWDRGTWTPIADAKRGYKKGHLEFALEGEKLHGRFHLVRIENRRESDRKRGVDNWLLIKADDEFARPEGAPDILEERPESVVSGKTVETIGDPAKSAAKAAPARQQVRKRPKKSPAIAEPTAIKGSRKARMPDFIPPALATLSANAPTRGDWLHEIKFDGYRIQARLTKGKVQFLTRSGHDWTERFGTAIPGAIAKLDAEEALIDGEIVIETANGSTDFSALQADLADGRSDRFIYYAFDLLHLDDADLRPARLIDRKTALAGLLKSAPDGPVRYSEHFEEDGEIVFRHACRLSLEGVISKRRDDPYPDGRSKSWLKSKCAHRQEFVVAGYVPSTADANAIGSLVLGLHDDKKGGLVHVGRVGTGFSRKMAQSLFSALRERERKTPPFADALPADARRGVQFVRPEMVVEVEYRAWTGAGNLRHAAFRGIREDKPAEDVQVEAAVTPEKKATKAGGGMASSIRPGEGQALVKLTNASKIYWPETDKTAAVTKGDLADYYAGVWRWIGPLLVERPLSLVRAPEGIHGHRFFQKHAWKGMHKSIRTLVTEKGDEPTVFIDDLEGLLGLVQGGVLEIHPWGTRGRTQKAVAKPDMLTMDIDPDEAIGWDGIVEAAFKIKERLEAAGLAAFVKTSGGKGLHVVSPLEPGATWPTLKAFTKRLADLMAKDEPERYVATVSKAKRKGKMLIDYLRNGKGATAVAAYSTRARDGAPVSMPLGWDEVTDLGSASAFTIANALQRLNGQDVDPWAEFESARRPLPPASALD
jgi:bifunctional non-homologous end joining protein LigD